jgi:hypothetical protein
VRTSETSVNFYKTTRRNIQKAVTLTLHCSVCLKATLREGLMSIHIYVSALWEMLVKLNILYLSQFSSFIKVWVTVAPRPIKSEPSFKLSQHPKLSRDHQLVLHFQ